MRWLVMADIHGNMVALEAVLRSEAVQDCDGAISLGDHTNFGPESRAVQLRLEEIGAIMLRGNHEDRFARLDTPEFAGYNWRSLHWTHQQLSGLNTDYPIDYRHGSFLFTHGTPGDPYHLVYPADLSPIMHALPEDVTHLFSGHSHEAWLLNFSGKIACNPGSLGMREDNISCSAPFAILEEQNGFVTVTQHSVPYSANEIQRRFITTGLAKIAPEMSRVVLHTMLTGEYSATLKLVKFVSAKAQSMGLTLGDEEAWRAADPIYPWAEPIPSAQYWRQLEEKLL